MSHTQQPNINTGKDWMSLTQQPNINTGKDWMSLTQQPNSIKRDRQNNNTKAI